ncbi:MAG: hypothetical protein ACT4OY_02865 [Alphaproteobacteria bacterium]
MGDPKDIKKTESVESPGILSSIGLGSIGTYAGIAFDYLSEHGESLLKGICDGGKTLKDYIVTGGPMLLDLLKGAIGGIAPWAAGFIDKVKGRLPAIAENVAPNLSGWIREKVEPTAKMIGIDLGAPAGDTAIKPEDPKTQITNGLATFKELSGDPLAALITAEGKTKLPEYQKTLNELQALVDKGTPLDEPQKTTLKITLDALTALKTAATTAVTPTQPPGTLPPSPQVPPVNATTFSGIGDGAFTTQDATPIAPQFKLSASPFSQPTNPAFEGQNIFGSNITPTYNGISGLGLPQNTPSTGFQLRPIKFDL